MEYVNDSEHKEIVLFQQINDHLATKLIKIKN